MSLMNYELKLMNEHYVPGTINCENDNAVSS